MDAGYVATLKCTLEALIAGDAPAAGELLEAALIAGDLQPIHPVSMAFAHVVHGRCTRAAGLVAAELHHARTGRPGRLEGLSARELAGVLLADDRVEWPRGEETLLVLARVLEDSGGCEHEAAAIFDLVVRHGLEPDDLVATSELRALSREHDFWQRRGSPANTWDHSFGRNDDPDWVLAWDAAFELVCLGAGARAEELEVRLDELFELWEERGPEMSFLEYAAEELGTARAA